MTAADVAGGQERFPIACRNADDSKEAPTTFTYIAHAVDHIRLSDTAGCSCAGRRAGGALQNGVCTCRQGITQTHLVRNHLNGLKPS